MFLMDLLNLKKNQAVRDVLEGNGGKFFVWKQTSDGRYKVVDDISEGCNYPLSLRDNMFDVQIRESITDHCPDDNVTRLDFSDLCSNDWNPGVCFYNAVQWDDDEINNNFENYDIFFSD